MATEVERSCGVAVRSTWVLSLVLPPSLTGCGRSLSLGPRCSRRPGDDYQVWGCCPLLGLGANVSSF